MSSREDIDLEFKIIDRAEKLGLITKNYPRITAICDIGYVKSNHGEKINLKRLNEAPDIDFIHDICGIASNIDRTEDLGSLKNLFSPRCGWVKK